MPVLVPRSAAILASGHDERSLPSPAPPAVAPIAAAPPAARPAATRPPGARPAAAADAEPSVFRARLIRDAAVVLFGAAVVVLAAVSVAPSRPAGAVLSATGMPVAPATFRTSVATSPAVTPNPSPMRASAPASAPASAEPRAHATQLRP